MKITIDLDEITLIRLDRAAKDCGGRDMLIQRALNHWFTRMEQKTREEQRGKPWPQDVLAFKGIPDLLPLESRREELPAPIDDPFA
ncbi:hypothetical protein D0T25_02945 [Duganella sp. BJB488]|uniref:hypothetical protein n=1 Tax=unclassified Duganella TaxID=2636909 RepID=UPI000E357755|nr:MULTISPECIES: hypothetical protein [unclassified Duganella]NVD73796.1 hypothetical protein [Duganella sp. BJB1802]RFP25846.1 hypothetical protein D0T26_00265 [Duganella sp. BJB489]RFP28413.1 hypothetical protein D0T25_02945 [Duganella sp. BJB488]RFP36776.1 hypothetical protein D0T24_08645 [Duganella sp. BJB480]